MYVRLEKISHTYGKWVGFIPELSREERWTE